ncbi:SDR family NAD(P)-dependent oxidoreductase [Phaeobacter gallaeciensis]|uniref:SDR family NAD(P)-dependent oxidoreductase n=1 Tax=Phaeobacter gallaeciensis TaxID=60890 RepID=UPI00237EFC6B|nr:SDR family oxidoreductase [Phaeobacter gallaeciensis]MDE4097560.1 SDR family NAD(P)-dependent oxidoreductase [Phaeobacter gallaeciensis]MDE4106602.1 SDR family NAD(P)-dependent oxidoreductase [Phaeobacter gallaeciensis]MDE4110824.1 SDR family NAD(P)-dependent oxidoreductase [Phaeobacter gallaeciensis]MDE4115527.1 SDR family NAD(P)-dependent oxidoreductase [Phaeobacter gallaeciensis]MDE4119997.1 SDR family NAD(P)-dependent oxidoreductase [Phaeobacter gallaeciensis]
MSVSFDFSGTSVLVTGASSGIGYGVAMGFARAGADLTILSSSDAIFDAAKEMPGKVQAIKCDISDAAAVTQALAHIEKLDVLINNAGLERPTPLTGKNPDGNATFEQIVGINITGTQNVTDTLVNRISDGGRIIITASIWAKTAVGGFSAYVASKHANVGLMRTWAQELGPRGIRVNAVCPGWVKTGPAMNSLRELAETSGQSEEELLQEIVSAQAIDGLMEPADMAATYMFLASDGGANITGQAINVDRGEVMA